MNEATKQQRIQELTDQERQVTQEKATEAPFTGAYVNNHEDGMYHCKVCGAPLFSSSTKFDSGTGWPSFDQPVVVGAVKYIEDVSHGMRRIEVTCGTCGAHLGHLFPDGPQETTGQRYCINSCSLDFEQKK
jgi:peptide-methionine (R)-S-oxide reductase